MLVMELWFGSSLKSLTKSLILAEIYTYKTLHSPSIFLDGPKMSWLQNLLEHQLLDMSETVHDTGLDRIIFKSPFFLLFWLFFVTVFSNNSWIYTVPHKQVLWKLIKNWICPMGVFFQGCHDFSHGCEFLQWSDVLSVVYLMRLKDPHEDTTFL